MHSQRQNCVATVILVAVLMTTQTFRDKCHYYDYYQGAGENPHQ